MKKLAITSLMIAALVSGAANAGIATAEDHAQAAALELVEQKSKHLDVVFAGDMDATADATRIYIADLDMVNVEIDQPDSHPLASNSDWELTDKDRAGLNKFYKDALSKRIGKLENYVIVDKPGSDTISIEAKLVELDPAAPKDDLKSRAPRDKYFSYGAGNATIEFTVSDQDGEVVMIAKDRRDAGNSWGVNDRFQNRSDVKRMFNSWARSLVKQLDLQQG